MRRFLLLHDPWLALCLASALPGVPVATFGRARERERFGRLGVEPILVPPPAELSTRALLDDPAVAAAIDSEPTLLISFKPSRRIEQAAAALGARFALAPAALSGPLENKLAFAALALEAGVPVPAQASGKASGPLSELLPGLRRPLVAQSPRSHAGKRTFAIDSEADWQALCAALPGRPLRVSERIEGRPGTLHAVVDADGSVLVSAPIVQVTGTPWLTPYALGSCGNDFTWRPSPVPEVAALAEAVGAVIARRGYRGYFGLDFVVGPDGPVLIEINPRLTASFALYAARAPDLLHAHLEAVEGRRVQARRLPPVAGGQLIAHDLTERANVPLAVGSDTLAGDLAGDAVATWEHPGEVVTAGYTRGRAVTRGVVVDEEGAIALAWRPDLTPPVSDTGGGDRPPGV